MNKENPSGKKRYFINNYFKSKFALGKIYGEPKCIFCGNNKILDLHHLYSYEKEKEVDQIVFVCPNHHYTFHRIIDNWNTYPSFYYKHCPHYHLEPLKKRMKFLDKQKIPYYLKGVIKPYFVALRAERMKKRYGSAYFNKERNKKNGVTTFDSGYVRKVGYSDLTKWFKKEDINRIPRCLICGNNKILDAHHVYKDERVIFLCPNHHYMVHRHLLDWDGDKTTVSEIKEKIKNIEKETKPYFQEVSEEEYKTKSGYNIMKIKE